MKHPLIEQFASMRSTRQGPLPKVMRPAPLVKSEPVGPIVRDKIAAMRERDLAIHWDEVALFGISVIVGMGLLVLGMMQAPLGWSPLP